MVESKYTLLDEMINDEIKDHINIEDVLGHNTIVETEKEKILFNIDEFDPFNLF